MFRGELIPDDVIIPKIMEVLKQPQYRSGVIMDGFPRTINQASALEEVCVWHCLSLVFPCGFGHCFHAAQTPRCQKANESKGLP